jgi:hypothetical protein
VYLQVVKLQAFRKFENTTDALAAATSLVDSKLPSSKPAFGPPCLSHPFCSTVCVSVSLHLSLSQLFEHVHVHVCTARRRWEVSADVGVIFDIPPYTIRGCTACSPDNLACNPQEAPELVSKSFHLHASSLHDELGLASHVA